MRNTKGAFDRTGEISCEPNQRVGWLEDLAETLAIQESTERVKTASRQSTAVEVARERYNAPQPSIYEMMSSIISAKKPKFSSVDEAVKHYQESTGLAQYLKAQKTDDMSALASVIVQADDDENPVLGKGKVSDILDSLFKIFEKTNLPYIDVIVHASENGLESWISHPNSDESLFSDHYGYDYDALNSLHDELEKEYLVKKETYELPDEGVSKYRVYNPNSIEQVDVEAVGELYGNDKYEKEPVEVKASLDNVISAFYSKKKV